MKSKTFNVNGVSCGHCVSTVKKALEDVEGITDCDVTLEKKGNENYGVVYVNYDEEKTGLDEIKRLIYEKGYFPEGYEE